MDIRKILIAAAAVVCAISVSAQRNATRISACTGVLYERGWDATVSLKHESQGHNAWEFFANGYLKWEECEFHQRVCARSFWYSYRTYCFGAAWKPCVARGRNHYGCMRLGGSLGSDTHEVIGGIHAGYEHSYALPHGWFLYGQIKTDMVINGKDFFRTGIAVGVKFNVN